jgi:hypothetical protein
LTWRLNYRKERASKTKLNIGAKTDPPKRKKEVFIDIKSKFDT